MLAVQVDYKSGQAIVATEIGNEVPIEEIVEALRSIGYQGEIVESPSD